MATKTVQLSFLDRAPKQKRDEPEGFAKLLTWANDPDPDYCDDAAADVLRLWNKYAAAQRRLKSLDAEAELAANRRKTTGKLATDYAGRLKEAEYEIERLEGKLAAANMPLRLAALFAALAGLALTLAVVL